MKKARSVLAVYACLSAVYLLYLPHALPVLDDWTFLRAFEQARGQGIVASLIFLRDLALNIWTVQFRVYWASYVPVFALSYAAGFTAWPYFLLAWAAHLLTAVLVCRIVSLLVENPVTGFAAGAIYAVLPAANNVLFWFVSSCFYHMQALGLAWWFLCTWRKLAVSGDYRYRWKDLGLLALVAFSGEQILLALLLLLPITYWLFGKNENHRLFLRFWSAHAAAVGLLLGMYAFILNRMPLAYSFRNRYAGGGPRSPWSFVSRGLASIGMNPGLAEWRPQWRPESPLLVLLLLAAAAFFWGIRRLDVTRPTAAVRLKLLLWSFAGVVFTYIPVALLPAIEWRYLYVPALFLAPGAAAALGGRASLAFLAVFYSIGLTYFETRQCWIPQSREAQAILDAVAAAGPIHSGETLIFAGSAHAMGTAPSFITGASWSLSTMLEHQTGAERVQGARDLLASEHGELALYRPDSTGQFTREDLQRLRVFKRDPGGRFLPQSFVALPAPQGRFELVPLRPSVHPPAQGLTREQLKTLPEFGDIYFAHPWDGPR